MWQDYALAAIGLGFVPSLWSTMKNPESKVPRSSSVPTAVLLFAMSGVFATLGAYFAAGSNVAVGAAWTFIAVRRAL